MPRQFLVDTLRFDLRAVPAAGLRRQLAGAG
jgi:hypothetical protein